MTALLFVLCWCTWYCLLQASLPNRLKWRNYRRVINLKKIEQHMIKLLRISIHSSGALHYKQLLQGCGLPINYSYYLILRRGAGIVGSLMMVIMVFMAGHANLTVVSVLGMILLLLWLLIILDKYLLYVLKQRRRERILKDIHTVSKQLLYYRGSNLNIHSKIQRCHPFTTTIRRELDLLIKEWYEGAGLAIEQFKQRIGTEEGYSFAETINSLRLNDDDRYYDLLRQRISDYKEKIELQRESKKETNSYVLFILAGLPILNTFRVFIYPWVQEGQRLFESLN